MKRDCKNCGISFEISDADLRFYDKLSPVFGDTKCAVPPPSHCSRCRNARRMAWRNDRTFYLRPSSLSKKRIISLYPEETPFPVYEPSEWYSDKWDPMDYGQEVDFSRPFFEQWLTLMRKVPRLGLDLVNCENSDYCNYCGDDKNCYLDIAGEANEDCYFNLFTKYSKDCVDCTFVYSSTLCYECINSHDCYNCRYSMYLDNCSDCYFCYDLIGCHNCLFSSNLRNKEYYVFNQQCSKTEYEQKLSELGLNSRSAVERLFEQWTEKRLGAALYRDMCAINCENCSGNNIKNCKNCHQVFNATNCEDCRFLYDVLDAKDCHDLNYSLYKPEVACELISTLQMRFSAFNMASHYCGNVFYCDLTNNSLHLFGCIGLNQKRYCILNKQYSEEEYNKLVPRLIEHMSGSGEWGEFFPAQISPFAYNETVAQEYIPLTKEKALAKGYSWKDPEEKDYRPQSYAVPDGVGEVDDGIVKEVLACTDCGRNYRIIQQELRFYRRQGIPVPTCCPECRHAKRMELRNPRQLWHRACSKCEKQVQTTYAPERPEKILCEDCYRGELY